MRTNRLTIVRISKWALHIDGCAKLQIQNGFRGEPPPEFYRSGQCRSTCQGLYILAVLVLLHHQEILLVIAFKLHQPRSLMDSVTGIKARTTTGETWWKHGETCLNRMSFPIFPPSTALQHQHNHSTITAQTSPSDALEVHVCSEEICELLVDIWISTLDLLHCVTLPHQILQPEPQQNTKHN